MSIVQAMRTAPADYAGAFGAQDITSTEMQNAVQEWYNLYFQKKATEKEDPCQQIPYTIVRKITKTVFAEYSTQTENKYAQDVLKSLHEKKEKAMQHALIGGECYLKPIPGPTGWQWSVITRPAMMVFGRDNTGRATDIGTAEVTAEGRFFYTLLERRTVDSSGYLTIRNMLYKSDQVGTLGVKVPLGILGKYENLPDEYTYPEKIYSVGLVQVAAPAENNVDGSDDPVSVYSAAVGLIHNINRNEAQLNGEFDRGESRIITSSDFMRREADGSRSFSDHIFIGLDEDPEQIGVTIFSPELRDEAYKRRREGYLRSVESTIGLKRGILSEVEATERTATEVTSSAGDYNLTIIDFQNMWTAAVKEAMRICWLLGKLYKVAGAAEVPEDGYTLDYGNGVLYDRQATEEAMKADVAANLLKPEIYVGMKYGQAWSTEEDRKKIRRDWMPDVLDDTGGI